MIAGYGHNITSIIVNAGSAVAGTTTFPVIKAPFGGLEVKSATIQALGSVDAHETNFVSLNLFDGGAAGTATTSIGTAGGTTGIANGPQAMTISTNNLDAGDYLMFRVIKAGTITEREYALIVEWVYGQG